MFQAAHPAALVYLARCAENANVAFYVWSDSQGVAEKQRMVSGGPWYELRAQADPPGRGLPGAAQLFCECLVHDLTSRRILEPSQADRLLAGWGRVA
jgi:hypothetical protein